MEKINLTEIINKWFEMKLNTYDKLEHDDSIYLYYKDEVYAHIRINKKDMMIFYPSDIWIEFSEIIPLERFEFERLMIKSFEDTFNLKGLTTRLFIDNMYSKFKIPLI